MSIGDFKKLPEEAALSNSEKKESKKIKRARAVFQSTLHEIEEITSLSPVEFKSKLPIATKIVHKLFSLSKYKETIAPEQTLKELSRRFNELPEIDVKVLNKLNLLQNPSSPNLQVDIRSATTFWRQISDILAQNPSFKTIEIQGLGSFERDDLASLVELDARIEPQNLAPTIARLTSGKFSLKEYKNQGYPLLFLHVIAGRSDLVASELQTTNVDMPDPNGNSALQWACYLGNKGIAEQLINAKADLNYGEPPPLFLASRHTSGIVELLIENGADLSIRDRDNINILAYLKASRPQHWKKTKQLIKNHMCQELFGRTQTYSKVYQTTKLISHVYSVKGTSFHRGHEIKLTGYYSPIQAVTAAKSIQAYAKLYPDFIGRSVARQLAQTLQFAADKESHTVQQVVTRIQKGIPTSFLTGFEGHSTTILIWGDLFIHCNRGEGSVAPLQIYRFNPSKLNENVIRVLQNGVTTKDEYKELLTSILPSELDFSQSANEQELQKLAALSMQTVGNCSWASVEGCVKAFLLVSCLKEQSFVLPADTTEKETLIASLDHTFRSWQVFQQIALFDKYLDNPADQNIVFMGFLSLWTANISEPTLIERIQKLEDKYRKSANYSDMINFLTHKLMCRAQLYSKAWMDLKGFTTIIDQLLETQKEKDT